MLYIPILIFLHETTLVRIHGNQLQQFGQGAEPILFPMKGYYCEQTAAFRQTILLEIYNKICRFGDTLTKGANVLAESTLPARLFFYEK